MRQFTKPIFMGAGKHSKKQSDLLPKRLEEGLSLLSGYQQLASSPANFKPTSIEELQSIRSEINDIVADITIALSCLGE